MRLPNEAEELLDVLRRKKLDEELAEITRMIESGEASQVDIRMLQFLEVWILSTYHREGPEGYRDRQVMCEEMARAKDGYAKRKVN